MHHSSYLYPIHTSQLKSFKIKAKALSEELTKLVPNLRLSAFQRNDYLAMALGYKGHSDLVTSASFRGSSHNEEELVLFSNCIIREDIIRVFLEKTPQVKESEISLSCLLLSENLSSFKARSLNDILATCSLDEIYSLINGVLTDSSSGWIWNGRASVLLRSVLSVLVFRRDKAGVNFTIKEVRDLLSIDNVKNVSEQLKESGVKDKVLLNYYIEIGEGISAEERHLYYQNLIEKAFSVIEMASCRIDG
tara:strand:- start:42 stop:788 length:747 start_codon:yes stop_codon:yes gene_type:complete